MTTKLLLVHVLLELRVEEKRVVSPREGTRTTVQELVGRRLGVLALVIVNEVLDVSLMFLLEVAGPESSSDNSRSANVEAYLAPHISGLGSMMLQSELLLMIAGLGDICRSRVSTGCAWQSTQRATSEHRHGGSR